MDTNENEKGSLLIFNHNKRQTPLVSRSGGIWGSGQEGGSQGTALSRDSFAPRWRSYDGLYEAFIINVN